MRRVRRPLHGALLGLALGALGATFAPVLAVRTVAAILVAPARADATVAAPATAPAVPSQTPATTPAVPSPTPTTPLPPDVVRALDDVVACQRPDGGWTYVCDPASGPHGAVTRIVVRATQIASWVGRDDWDLLVLRSPGTAAAGLVLLEGHRRGGEARWLAAARQAGDVLVATQLSSGGWASEMPVHGRQLARWFRWLNRWTALDDDVTSGAARFLTELWAATGEDAYRAAAERAFALLLAAQLPGGGWPLTWREPRFLSSLSPSFEDLPSTNDAATSGPIEALLVGARLLGRPDLRAAAGRGGDWLLRVRGPARQAAWAQQYEPDGAPAPGRRFEPVGYAAWESREMLDALLALARDGEADATRICATARDGVAWFVGSALSPGCWARLYAPGDDRPLFVARDGRVVATAAEAKRPYRWTGDYGIPGLLGSLGLDTGGNALAPEAPRPPRRIPGDPGACPGGDATEPDDRQAPNPRKRIARAAALLSTSAPLPPSPCPVATLLADGVPADAAR